MNITKAEAAALGRRREQPVKQPGELIAIWCPGILKNPLNGAQYGRQKFAKARYRVEWKARVAQALLEARVGGPPRARDMIPVVVTFTAGVFHLFRSEERRVGEE